MMKKAISMLEREIVLRLGEDGILRSGMLVGLVVVGICR